MNDLQSLRLDTIDHAIIAALVDDGRMSNAMLARRVNIAESTSINRVRALRDAGVITGFHAHVDLRRVGRAVQAVIHVQLKANCRDQLDSFQTEVAALPGLIAAFYVSGSSDYLVHVAVEGCDELRDIVANRIAAHPSVNRTETQLVLDTVASAPT
jgi:DNA-binding Lrp family transcriptional regulator